MFPFPPNPASTEAPADRPPTPPLEPEQPKPSLSIEDEEEVQGAAGLQHKTLLDIDRFTLCGNRID